MNFPTTMIKGAYGDIYAQRLFCVFQTVFKPSDKPVDNTPDIP